jgi:hypothetical protein
MPYYDVYGKLLALLVGPKSFNTTVFYVTPVIYAIS